MKRILPTLLLFALALWTSPSQAQNLAVKGETVYTMAGAPIQNGIVLVKDGKIERVGTQASVSVPNGYEIVEAKVVMPGLIDARTVVGLAGYLNQPHDQDQLDRTNAIQPELRAIDAYNAQEFLVGYLRSHGVTTMHTGHGPGAVISGQTMIVKTHGETVAEALVDSSTMLAVTLGSSVRSNFQSPGTRSKALAVLRQELFKAQEYSRKRKADESQARDLKMESLADLLDGKVTAMVAAHMANDIVTALRLQKEFGFKMVLNGAAEAYLVMDEIKASGVPVLIHPTMLRTSGDAQNATFETAAKVHAAGIPMAFQSSFEGYVPKTRVVLYEAAIAVANGLPHDAALRALTIDSAKILGIDNRVGSLVAGKDADLALYNGDPFEYLTSATNVIINGKLLPATFE